MRLEGARCLVTGGGSGIGRAIVLALLARGAAVVTCGRRADALAALQAEAGSDRLTVVTADVADPAGRARLVDAALAALGGLDLLVNNAGRVAVGPVARIDAAELQAVFDVNVVAPYALCRDLQGALARSRGRIVMIGSMFGDIAFPLFAGYSASKFALRGLGDGLRRELASEGIKVTYVAPRATRTPAADGFLHLEKAFAMQVDAPERVGAQVVDAVAAGRDHVYPGPAEALFRVLQLVLPRLVDGALVSKMAAYRREVEEREANPEGPGGIRASGRRRDPATVPSVGADTHNRVEG